MSEPAEESLLVTYSVEGSEPISEAIVDAFLAAQIDVFEREERLQEQISTDALEGFDWGSNRSLQVHCELWGHRVVVTPDAIAIYERRSS
jgi:hypothetical protein